MAIEQGMFDVVNSLSSYSLLLAPLMGAIYVKLFKEAPTAKKPSDIISIYKQLQPYPIRHLLSGMVHDLVVKGTFATYKVNVTPTKRGKDAEADLTMVPPASKQEAGTILIMDKEPNTFKQGTVRIHIDKHHDDKHPLPIGEQPLDEQGKPTRGAKILGIIWYSPGE